MCILRYTDMIHDTKKLKINSRYDSCFDKYAKKYNKCMFGFHLKLRCVWSCVLFLFFFWCSRVLGYCGYCLMNSSRNFWPVLREQCICALFTDPQISFFINFFIKYGSHSTIYTFKNYFATVFSVFSFQF